jgi:hypothetical protein
MRAKLRTRLRLVLLIAGALAVCASGWSDAASHSGYSNVERICYCDCDAASGSPMCMHMCDLAKYESRSWAASCHKKKASEPAQPSTKPGVHSTKDNRIQQARR